MNTPQRSRRGYTLIELMVVVGLIAIISGLAIGGMRQLAARTAVQNVSHDLYSAMSVARARATQTGSDVWFIVYPAGGPPGQQRGAFYVFEDRDGQFRSTSGTYTYRDHFRPDNLTVPSTSKGKLYLSGILYEYSANNVTFGFHGKFPFGAPFTTLNPTTNANVACSFCRPTAPFSASSRGAIVFGGDGSARFVDNTGAAITPTGGAVSLAVVSRDQTKATLYAVSAATGFIAQFNR